MKQEVLLFVEGVADKKFLHDYLRHLIPDFKVSDGMIVDSGGWTSIDSQKHKGESIRNQMNINTANGGLNLVIFDADKNYSDRMTVIQTWKSTYNLEFELFLLPNNNDSGDLETLLELIINKTNQPIFNCWADYEHCLAQRASKSIGKPLTLPAKKSKIYGYLEALMGETKNEKKQIKERERNYLNAEHWNLNATALLPLKNFLLQNIHLPL